MDKLFSSDYLFGIVSTFIYSILGLVLLILCYVVVDKLTHFSLHQELSEKQNVAVAIVIGCMLIALAIILGSVIRS